MINRIKSFLAGGGEAGGGESGAAEAFSDIQVAAAALLVEAAFMDEEFGEAERRTVATAVRERFGLNEEEAASLIEVAEGRQAEASHLLRFTRAIKDGFNHQERVELLEMLWEVVYADHELHHYEANLMRRLGGLLYVPDRENWEARKRVLDKAGRPNR